MRKGAENRTDTVVLEKVEAGGEHKTRSRFTEEGLRVRAADELIQGHTAAN